MSHRFGQRENVVDDQGWEAALETMTDMLSRNETFYYVRFGGSELNSAAGLWTGQKNDLQTYTEEISASLNEVLNETRVSTLQNLIVGGTCVVDPRHKAHLQKLGYKFTKYAHRPDSWAPCHVIASGIESRKSLRMIQLLSSLGQQSKLYLVGNSSIRDACRSQLLGVSESESVNNREKVKKLVEDLPKDSVVLYCAGMGGKLMMWDSINSRPDLTQIDMGHFFDRAYGINNRSWHCSDNPVRRSYDTYYAPVIKEDV